MKKLITILLLLAAANALRAADTGDEVIVVYNTRMPGSKDVADHYAAMRNVPPNQVFGLALTTNEDMSRAEFRDALQKPLAKALESKKLWRIGQLKIPAANGRPEIVVRQPLQSKIRYAVLCYGVPLRIEHDVTLKEEVPDTLRPELRRDEAAVDNELALLPCIEQNKALTGPLANFCYAVTNAALFNPTNGILMVARLDGPSAAIARGLVDKAMAAESNGLCGRAYFDLRNLPTDSPLKLGDDWISAAARVCQYFEGYETTIDENPGTFPADFPMSQIAVYCGWYDEHASGPFAQKNVEFMPGAFAYHLHSFSAATVRSTTRQWVGPFLAKGATATMGCVYEPYLGGTPDIGAFCARWMVLGFTFGEAAYASQEVLSWQATVIGDPLYSPFAKPLSKLIVEQDRTHSKWIEWSYLRVANLNLAERKRPAEVMAFLQSLPVTKNSAVLTEKLADLYNDEGMPSSAIESYQNALQLSPSTLQAVRIRLELADKLVEAGQTKDAYAALKALLKDDPEYPGKEAVLKKIQNLTGEISGTASTNAPQLQTNP
jgi:uncharacterized protein (TIGR03790 family)